jgi:hypothetical protein
MKTEYYSCLLNQYDYNLLKNNIVISTCCGSFLKKFKIKGDQVKLLLTKYQLNDLTGFVAAEANHASSKREEQELSDIFEILESNLLSILAR